jgi:hypothetical protein
LRAETRARAAQQVAASANLYDRFLLGTRSLTGARA